MFTNEYQPSPYGLQVLLSVHNDEAHLKRCLDSLNTSLRDHNWVLLYGDDASKDESVVELAKNARQLTCDKVHLYEYDKAATTGQAKNRLIKEAHDFKEKYPYILFMDADDEMLPERPCMIQTAIDKKSQYVVGAWNKIEDYTTKFHPAPKSEQTLCFGPWATLFHCDFLPEDGLFFPEDELCNTGYEDVLTWYHLKHIKNQTPTIHESVNPVHNYIVRSESVSNTKDVKVLNARRNTFWGISDLIKDNNRNIYDNPITAEESEKATQAYVERKQNKNRQKSQNPLL